MKEIMLKAADFNGLTEDDIIGAVRASLYEKKDLLKKVLILPPDFTRMHSGAGKITALYYEILKDTCEIDVMPALGSHEPMSEEEIREFFCNIVPVDKVIKHDWRNDVVKIGEIPREFVEKVSEGLLKEPIPVEINKRLLDPTYDMIISVGQVVPHEVVGMANYSKNIFVGCGGREMISSSHILGALVGLEKIMGRDSSPVRKVFDYAEEHFINNLPILYVLSVTTQNQNKTSIDGLFMGRSRKIFEEAVGLSQSKNLTLVERPLKKVIVSLDKREFKSTWVGNKGIYRTRMAIADGGELIILAPGVRKFGEDSENDLLIRKYGYIGSSNIIDLCKSNCELSKNLSAAAHLIQGSTDGRFTVTYAVDQLTKEEVESVNYRYMPLKKAYEEFKPYNLTEGFNILEDGTEAYYIKNPALGLWVDSSRI